MCVCACDLKEKRTAWWVGEMAEVQKRSGPVDLNASTHTSASAKGGGGGGQEMGSSVGWGNSPETVWVITLSLP